MATDALPHAWSSDNPRLSSWNVTFLYESHSHVVPNGSRLNERAIRRQNAEDRTSGSLKEQLLEALLDPWKHLCAVLPGVTLVLYIFRNLLTGNMLFVTKFNY